jgi:hypothetical protein
MLACTCPCGSAPMHACTLQHAGKLVLLGVAAFAINNVVQRQRELRAERLKQKLDEDYAKRVRDVRLDAQRKLRELALKQQQAELEFAELEAEAKAERLAQLADRSDLESKALALEESRKAAQSQLAEAASGGSRSCPEPRGVR